MHGFNHGGATAACALPWLQPLFARVTLNLVLLGCSLLLECALVWAVFRRGIARSFPGFTALLLLYPLRAAALFVLSRSVDEDTYHALFGWLEAAEIPLLAWVWVELALRLVRRAGGWSVRRSLAILLLVAAALNLAWILPIFVPEKGLADRVQVTAGFLMLELFGVALFGPAWRGERTRWGSGNLVCIPAGFAAFAVFQFAAVAGKAHAMTRHASGAYIAWSYVPACGFLAVVVFWLAALRPEQERRGVGFNDDLHS
jgi:hypothetical protein